MCFACGETICKSLFVHLPEENGVIMNQAQSGRYSTQGLTEGQYEPGSQDRVCKNLLGIKSKRKMDKFEADGLLTALKTLITYFDVTHKFTAEDVRFIHKTWLGQIYAWAGKYRQVNLSKGFFSFAAANQIPRLMAEFEKNELATYTPCNFKNMDDIVTAIAIVHTELVLIHPFREGNGRMSRMLADFMAVQANLPLLNYSGIRGKRRKEYFAAVRAGLAHNYKPMINIFSEVIKRTLKDE